MRSEAKPWIIWGAGIILASLWQSPVSSQSRAPAPENRIHRYSVTRGEPMEIPARKVKIPLVVYGDEAGKQPPYIPSGYMGDGNSLSLSSVYESAPLPDGKQGQTSLRINYSVKGSQGWAGIYWLSPANNWGRVKGGGVDLSKARRLTFWIRGEKGGEVINKVQMGGVTSGEFPDSDVASLGPLTLTADWEQYSIDLSGKDLRHIIGGFCFIIRRVDNKAGATFYVDEIVYEREGKPGAAVEISSGPPVRVAKSTGTASTIEVANAEPDSAVAQEAIKSPIRKMIPFSTAFNVFDDQSKKVLGEMVKMALANPGSTIVLEGHTDNIGPPGVNLRLSKERATAVADYLVSQGIKKERLIVIGYGGERPLTPHSNSTAEGRKKNRRVEIVLIP